MQKSLFIILLLVFNLTFGQEKDDPTDSLILELKSKLNDKAISDFFVLKRITYGISYLTNINDSNACRTNDTHFTMYAFWKDEKTSYVKKFENCGEFNTVKLENSQTTDYFKENIEKIKSSKVEMYQTTPDSIVDGINYRGRMSRTHQPQRYYWFFTSSNEFTNRFDTFNLSTDKKNPNLNYEANNNLAIVQLNDQCEKAIDKLNRKKAFNRL